MGRRICIAVFALALLAGATQYATASPSRIELICPNAAVAIDAFRALPDTDAPQVEAAAKKVVATYQACTTTIQSKGGQIEPFVHFTNTRAAQFSYAAGRAALEQQHFDEARALFTDAHRLAESVALFNSNGHLASPSQAIPSVSRSDRLGLSIYHDVALTIMKSADEELVKLGIPVALQK
jgi:hypothetical protein